MNRFLIGLALALPSLVAQTGAAVPELTSVDRDITALMHAANVPGGAVAIVKDGRLVFAHGYGFADTARGEAFQPDSLCRIGSISKTVTAVTLLQLAQSGKLGLDDRVFADILTQLTPVPGAKVDPRLKDITVRHLLHHTGGHGRDTGVDPMTIDLAKAAADEFHLSMPPGYDAMVRIAMGLPLDFTPGTKYSYSNYGFTVLGRVVERVTGQPYEDVVRRQVLEPMGIRRMAVGHTLMEDRLPGEVIYYDSPRMLFTFSLIGGVRRLVPRPYANFELEAGDSCGRWIGSAVDLARFVARVEGTRAPAFFDPATFQLLLERPNPFVTSDPSGRSWYALGAGAFPNGSATGWTHGGFYPGATAGYYSFGDGYLFAFVFNATPGNDTFTNDVYNVLAAVGLNQKSWPSHDLFPSTIRRIDMSRFLLTLALVSATLFAGDDSPLPRGAKELGLSGTVYVTHDSPEDLFGVVTIRGGYYVAKNQQVGIDATVFAYSRIQDTYLSGFYRYYFAGRDRRLAPFVGSSVGANLSHFDYIGSQHSLMVRGEAGIRYLLPGKFSLDVSYNLMYRRNASLGLTGTTSSILTFGFSRTF